MPPVGYLLWYFPDTVEFGESLPTGEVVTLPPDTLILKAEYLPELQVGANDLAVARHRLAGEHSYAHLLRIVPSTDGPPFRSALVYARSTSEEVDRVRDWRLPPSQQPHVYRALGLRYVAVRIGTNYSWESDAVFGRLGYFLTGVSGPSALWRVMRIEGDALDRQVVTLFPARLPHPIAAPDFTKVADPLRGFLEQHFDGFKRAVAGNLYLDVVNRAGSLAEGILEYCFALAGRPVPASLFERIEEVRKVIADPSRPSNFPLSAYSIVLADRIRLLHQRIQHANRAVQGQHLRPEVGLSAAIDVSELMVEAGLGHY